MQKEMSGARSSKSKKIVIVVLLALVMCGIAAVGVYQVLSPQRANVYVFNDNYPAGTQISRNMLTTLNVDSSVIAANAKLSTGDYFVTDSNFNSVIQTAGVLRADVNRGTPLMTSMLTTTGGNRIEMTMKANAVAVSIGVNNVTGVTKDMRTGSRVNVYSCQAEKTELLLENVRILEVSSNGESISSVVLEVSVSESIRLVHAYNFGVVHLGIVDMKGYQAVMDTAQQDYVEEQPQTPDTMDDLQDDTDVQ